MFALQINFSGVFEKVAVRESSKKYSIFPKCDLAFFWNVSIPLNK